jgi:phosphoglycerate dehydrogenase-like enzyme
VTHPLWRRIAVLPEPDRAWLADVHEGSGATLVGLEEAEALLWASDDPRGLADALRERPSLAWVHLPVAGVERFAHLIDGSRIWTCAKGANAEAVAEHALGLLLAQSRGLVAFARSRTWEPRTCRSLRGARVVVVGAGAVARALVELLIPIEARCVLLSTTPRSVDGADWRPIEMLDDELPRADFLVLAAALTPSTRRILDARRLALLRPSAAVINVARGELVDHDALRAAVAAGGIAGVALDVTDPEPLPAGDPLFSSPRCLVTCHSAARDLGALEALRARARTNLDAFVAGGPLLGRVDAAQGY